MSAPIVRDPDDARSTLPLRWPARIRASLPAGGASLGLHLLALLALAWWVEDREPIELAEPGMIKVTLDSLAPTEAEPAPRSEAVEPAADRPQAIEEPVPRPEPVVPDVPAIAESPVAETASPEFPDEETIPPADRAPEPRVDLQQLREQITTLTLSDPESEENDRAGFSSAPDVSLPWARAGDRIRGVPLGGGWLNPWVGPVAAYSETWGSIIGEQRGVHVLSNGQVICTRVDAPTNDEMMNPWMSMRVTYVRLCGKERGTAPPTEDLRYAPPPPSLRRDPD